jgi:hypoxanthine-guanine phosphoribosyltransferase
MIDKNINYCIDYEKHAQEEKQRKINLVEDIKTLIEIITMLDSLNNKALKIDVAISKICELKMQLENTFYTIVGVEQLDKFLNSSKE